MLSQTKKFRLLKATVMACSVVAGGVFFIWAKMPLFQALDELEKGIIQNPVMNVWFLYATYLDRFTLFLQVFVGMMALVAVVSVALMAAIYWYLQNHQKTISS